jgi:hypothetical protein
MILLPLQPSKQVVDWPWHPSAHAITGSKLPISPMMKIARIDICFIFSLFFAKPFIAEPRSLPNMQRLKQQQCQAKLTLNGTEFKNLQM